MIVNCCIGSSHVSKQSRDVCELKAGKFVYLGFKVVFDVFVGRRRSVVVYRYANWIVISLNRMNCTIATFGTLVNVPQH